MRKGGFFWLDLNAPDTDAFDILREAFGFNPLAVEDSENFERRAKLEDYGDFVFSVVYGASADEDRLVEVHCFCCERFLLTIHPHHPPGRLRSRAWAAASPRSQDWRRRTSTSSATSTTS